MTPKLVGANAEGGANVFRVDYCGRPAYLAQSPQLYKQIMVGVFERVYEVAPIFRAEPHDAPRHLNECVSLDAELGFISDHREVTALLREVVAEMLTTAAECGFPVPEVPAELPVLDFAEALRIGGGADDEPDLAPAHEAAVGDRGAREQGSDFVLVEGFPLRNRAFYTHPDPSVPGRSRAFDLIFRGWEVCSGSQRLHVLPDYLDVMRERGMNPAAFEGYLSAFRHGMPPHGGFAIGLERFTARLMGKANVREATLFPRDLNRLTP
jgi:nondiscriminating aspartyl-tRNA synthetase